MFRTGVQFAMEDLLPPKLCTDSNHETYKQPDTNSTDDFNVVRSYPSRP